MKFTGFALAAALCLAPVAHADEAAHALSLKVPDGARLKVHVVRSDDKSGPGGKSQLVAAYDIVTGYTGSGDHRDAVAHLQAMTVEKLIVNGAPAPAGFDLKGFGNMLFLADNVPFDADADLAPVRIKDMPALKANNTNAMLGYMSSMGQAVSADMKAQVAQSVARSLDQMSPETAAEQYLPEAALLAVAHGLTLTVGKPQTTTQAIATPFGPQGQGTVTLGLTKWDAAGDTASVTYARHLDPAALKAFVKANMPNLLQMFGVAGGPAAATTRVVDDMVIKRDTTCTYDVAISTGLVRSAHCTVESGAQYKGAGQLEANSYDLSETLVTP